MCEEFIAETTISLSTRFANTSFMRNAATMTALADRLESDEALLFNTTWQHGTYATTLIGDAIGLATTNRGPTVSLSDKRPRDFWVGIRLHRSTL